MPIHPIMEGRDGSAVRRVGEEDFRRTVLEGSHLKPVCVEFWTRGGEPRSFSDPLAEQIAEALAGRAVIAEMNVEDNPVISGSYEIRVMPTFLLFKRGVVVERILGPVPPRAVADRLAAWMDASPVSAPLVAPRDLESRNVAPRSWTNAG